MNSSTTPVILFSENGKLNIEGVKKDEKNFHSKKQASGESGQSLLQQATKRGPTESGKTNGHLVPAGNKDAGIKHSRKSKSLYEARPGTSNGSSIDKGQGHSRSKTIHGPRTDRLNSSGSQTIYGAEEEESPKRLRRIQSLARSAKYSKPKPEQDKTKRNLTRLLLQEDNDSNYPNNLQSRESFDVSVSKANGKSLVKKTKTVEDPVQRPVQSLSTIKEGPKTEGRLDSNNSSISQPNDKADEAPSKKRNEFKEKRAKTQSIDTGFGSFEIIESEESNEKSSNTLDHGSQKGAIASYLFTGLNTQLLPAYIGSDNQEKIQAQIHTIPEDEFQPVDDEVFEDNGLGRHRKQDRLQKRAQSVDLDDRFSARGKGSDSRWDHKSKDSVKDKINGLERASSEPPEFEKDFLKGKGPLSHRRQSLDHPTDEPVRDTVSPSKRKFQPDELKSKMADTSVTSDSVDQDVYVGQLREVSKICLV